MSKVATYVEIDVPLWAPNGLLANRCVMCDLGSSGATQIMSRSGHLAMSAISNFQIVVQNVFINSSTTPVAYTESGQGGSATITASVEYPAGVFTQITFGGVAQGTIPNKDVLFSDFVDISIPINALFWIRSFYNNATGVTFYNSQNNAIYGDLLNFGTGSLTDQTMGGTITNSGLLCSYGPLAIIGPTTRASVLLVGDSITARFNVPETVARLGDTGMVMPSTYNAMATLNMANPGGSASSSFAGNYLFRPEMPVTRKMIGNYYSHVICSLGVNDSNSLTSDQVIAALQAVYNLFPSEVKIYQTTITPYTTSTDGWITTANQTIATGYATRVAVNAAIRTGQLDRLSGYFETADVLESARDSGKWVIHSPPPATSDGLHPNASGYALVQASGAINPNVLLANPFRTFRFAVDASYLPSNIDCIPSIKNVSVTPAIISLGENLGQRASVAVTLKDHKFSFLTDSYDSGTFWGKFRGRYGLKLQGYNLRLIRGDIAVALENMETRHYVIESTDGPTPKGEYKIIAKDMLKLADGDRSQAPIPSNGFTSASVTNVAGSFTMQPTGIGASEYPASGYINIGGKEICSFTRSGDVMTITRAQFNTTASAHDAGERVQLCLQFTTANVADIISTLLITYAGVSSSYIPLATWQTETNTFLNVSYSALIAEPTSVNKLISELVEQAGLAVWWGDITQQVHLQVLRSIASDADVFNGDNYLVDSLEVKEQPEKRLSQVYTYFAKLNPLVNEDQINNYRSTAYAVDAAAEADYGGTAAIKKIYSRWIPDGGRAIANTLNSILLSRFRDPPRRIKFDLLRDLPDGGFDPVIGTGYQIEGWPFQDETGAEVMIPSQITWLNPGPDIFEVEAEELSTTSFSTGLSPDRHTIIIDSNRYNVNMRTLHDSVYGVPLSGTTVECIIQSGIFVGSTSTSSYAFDASTWPAGVIIKLTVNGRIQGAGGAGGAGHSTGLTGLAATVGSPGGGALIVRQALTLVDSSGQIFGGAGGGGGGNGGFQQNSCGGGGAGNVPGAHGGGDAYTFHSEDGNPDGGGNAVHLSTGVDGGSGGPPGQAGYISESGHTGGAAGPAINGIGFVTTVGGAGDRRGPQV